MTVSWDEMLECLVECGMQIAREVQDMLEETQPELVADIYAEGIVLTGGSARLYGFDNLIAKKTKLPVHVAENPDHCVVLGAGKGLEYIDKMDQKGEGDVYKRQAFLRNERKTTGLAEGIRQIIVRRKEQMAKKLFTSESVTEGHPDKVCDQISDAVLDAIFEQDPQAHVALSLIHI